MSEPHWASGPGEILRHGLTLLKTDTDTNRRLAMISIDNSVELMMQTYITLPKRLTGLAITRRERDEICSSFPSLLDGIELHASEKILGINLGEIEWFHRLRNELYHQGNGLTVERRKVEVYAELANVLFENLFGTKLEIEDSKDLRDLGEFISTWANIEKQLSLLTGEDRPVPATKVIQKLRNEGKLTDTEYEEFQEIRRTRNEVVHGVTEPRATMDKQLVNRVGNLAEIITKIAAGIF